MLLPRLRNTPLDALELSKKVVPPVSVATPVSPLLVKVVKLPAVALPENLIPLKAKKPKWMSVTKFCIVPELFTIPTPLILRVKSDAAVIV